jgi:hypothetical protein
MVMGGAEGAHTASVGVIVIVATLGKLVVESAQRHGTPPDDNAALSAELLQGPLQPRWSQRVHASLLAGVVTPTLWLAMPEAQLTWAVVTMVGCLFAEVWERRLFFAAAAAPRMPGGLVG